MPAITGRVWDDLDADLLFTGTDIPLTGIPIRITGPGDFSAAGQTATDGTFSINTDAAPLAGTFTVTADLDDTWIEQSNHNPYVFEYALSGAGPINFAFVQRCFRPLSSWVKLVCYTPRGVRVTFRETNPKYSLTLGPRGLVRGPPRPKGPWTCIYPGTTLADYTLFRAAPSAGKHVHAFYFHRPYIPMTPAV